ncbi:hypothetical protein MSHI_00850 [Mycobacterium shinjukuense]|uniref:Uncharacterized protein n=1 Tax=Mycobacterium shinjukuense TaxID=398694 RepID=A0A7I7MLN1_9MYCO|nr:hypothetical protein MSHI_00850 [Mycobacterium shinjukuense]
MGTPHVCSRFGPCRHECGWYGQYRANADRNRRSQKRTIVIGTIRDLPGAQPPTRSDHNQQ